MDINKLTKKLKGKYGSVGIVGEETDPKEYISTGNYSLDLSLGNGIAWGYVSEFSGLSQSGKTTMLQLMLAHAQREFGAIGIWVDRENAWHNDRAESLGIDLNNVIRIKPQDIPTIPEAHAFLVDTLKDIPKDVYRFISLDSISAFHDTAKIDKSDMGKKAMQIHRLFRDIIPYINERATLNFANQITYKTGVMFGDPRTTTGGEAPKYYASYRIMLDNRNDIIDENRGDEKIGNWIRAVVIKTRSGPSYRTVYFPHYYSSGIPFYGGYARLLVDRNYLSPKNRAEFAKFKQTTVIYRDNHFNEYDIEEQLNKYPELLFEEYPKWNEEEKNIDNEKDSIA